MHMRSQHRVSFVLVSILRLSDRRLMRFRLAVLPEVLPEAQSRADRYLGGRSSDSSEVRDRRAAGAKARGLSSCSRRDRVDDPSSIPLVLDQVRVPEEPELVGNPGL
ncbi:MAG: hypothetical protein MZV64_52920 [Ignavibacteriales bacterium]|nr:hypothetical protein [Ignavibacteriales bacterium]